MARYQQVEIRVFQIESLAEIEICERSLKQVNARSKVHFVSDKIFKSSFIPRFKK